MNRLTTHLVVALERIIEISYSGHPDGRETRLEMITRIANSALKIEAELAKGANDGIRID